MMSSSNQVYYGTIEEKFLMGYSQGLENLLSNWRLNDLKHVHSIPLY